MFCNDKKEGYKGKDIANKLNRSYWGIVDKIRRMRQECMLKIQKEPEEKSPDPLLLFLGNPIILITEVLLEVRHWLELTWLLQLAARCCSL